ncbi:MAG: hypothetical protein V4625_09535 [Pseudomonadota bacterium]
MQLPSSNPRILWLIAIGLFFPLFFQLSGHVFNSEKLVIDSGGVLTQLPLPFSLIACLAGILMSFRHYRRAGTAAVFILTLALGMLLSVLFAAPDGQVVWRKLLLALQFLLPTMGLVLGQLVDDEQNVIPKAFLWVLCLLVPVQLLASWWQLSLTLTHYFYVFSIYQHFQFVPVIFVIAYCLVMVHLWTTRPRLLKCLTFVMGIYAMASAAFLAISAYCGFLVVFFLLKMSRRRDAWRAGLLTLVVSTAAVVSMFGIYFLVAKSDTEFVDSTSQYANKFKMIADGKLPLNVVDRMADWKMYGDWIVESQRTLVFGHIEPPPRAVKTSAHNWYLDFVYNFGLISMFPVLVLIACTAWAVVRQRKTLPEETLWLAGLVAFLVLVDSVFKVTLRQPYPGIFAYFLWGLLLTRLRISPLRLQKP